MDWPIRPANIRQHDEQAPAASSLTRNTAAPRASVRRAGHAAPCAVGPVAREKGNWAATLRTAPWVLRLPGAARVTWGRSTKTDFPRVLNPVPQPRRRFSPLCIPFGR